MVLPPRRNATDMVALYGARERFATFWLQTEDRGQALKVDAVDGEIVEEEIPCRLLEERVASRSVAT